MLWRITAAKLGNLFILDKLDSPVGFPAATDIQRNSPIWKNLLS